MYAEFARDVYNFVPVMTRVSSRNSNASAASSSGDSCNPCVENARPIAAPKMPVFSRRDDIAHSTKLFQTANTSGPPDGASRSSNALALTTERAPNPARSRNDRPARTSSCGRRVMVREPSPRLCCARGLLETVVDHKGARRDLRSWRRRSDVAADTSCRPPNCRNSLVSIARRSFGLRTRAEVH